MSREPGGGSAPLIHLCCFGGLHVTAETALGPAFLQPRVVAALAILAVNGSKGIDEEQLLELLESDPQNDSDRLALTTALALLRADGAGGGLITGTTILVLNPARVDTDIARFIDACVRRDIAAAAVEYTGPFLKGVAVGAGPRFDAWVVTMRDRFAEQHRRVVAAEQDGGALHTRRRWIAAAVLLVVAIIAVVTAVRRTSAHRQGEEAVARGDWPAVRAASARVLAADSSDAWAWYRLARAADALEDTAAADSAAWRADSLAEEFPADRTRLIHAFRLWRDGDVASAVAALDSAVNATPDEPEAQRLLGEVLFRSGPVIGKSVTTSRVAFERAVRLEPRFAIGWQRLLRAALMARDTAGAERAWVGLRTAMGPAADTAYGWLRSTWAGDSLSLQRALHRIDTLPPATLLEHARLLGFEAGRTPEALALTEPLLGDQVAAPIRINARVLRAALYGAVGDWPRADAEAVLLARDWPWGGLMVAVAAALAPSRTIGPVALRALRARVMGAPLDGSVVVDGWLPPASRTIRLYLVGELSARLNDGRGLQAAIDSLASPKLGEVTLPRRGGSYALTLQAVQFAARGDTTEALVRLELAAGAVPLAPQRLLWVGGSLERRRRVLFLGATGRDDEAADWAASIGEFPADLMLGPPR